MLATASASSAPAIILDLTSSNWTPFKKQTFRLLQTKYGRIGNAVITGTVPPTNTTPTRNDVNNTGAPIFHRLPPTAAQTTANIPQCIHQAPAHTTATKLTPGRQNT